MPLGHLVLSAANDLFNPCDMGLPRLPDCFHLAAAISMFSLGLPWLPLLMPFRVFISYYPKYGFVFFSRWLS